MNIKTNCQTYLHLTLYPNMFTNYKSKFENISEYYLCYKLVSTKEESYFLKESLPLATFAQPN